MRTPKRILEIALCIALVALASLPFRSEAHSEGFTANKGQVHDQFGRPNQRVLYLSTGPGMNVQLRKNGFSYDTYSVREGASTIALDRTRSTDLLVGLGADSSPITYDFHRIDIHFVNGHPQAAIVQEGERADYTNYYTDVTGEAGATYVRSYSTIIYRDVWPHIDVRFNSGEDGFKYDVIVHPGGDLNDARFHVEGAAISESLKGRLVLNWGTTSLEELIPDSWMELGRRKERVNAHYRMMGNDQFGFVVDRPISGTLVIDPSPIIWGTYLGGGGSDEGRGVALQADQCSVVTGYTLSASQMATAGTHDATYNSTGDAYLAKFSPTGMRQWSTYFGGAAKDEANGVALGPNGDVVIVGTTASVSGIASAGAFQPALGLSQETDGFIARFSSTGTRVWSTYYGGSQWDQLYAVSVSTGGHIGVCGYAISPDALGTPGTADPTWNGGGDAYIGLFTPTGARIWGTYLGGELHEAANGIAFIGENGLLVTGETGSTSGVATNTVGIHDATANGIHDAFLARYDMNGLKIWATYYGGSNYDEAFDVDLLDADHAALCGSTSSPTGIASAGSQQPAFAGGLSDGMLAVFNIHTGARIWGSYHGTSGPDELRSLESAENGHFCVGGVTLFRSQPAFAADYRNDGIRYYMPVLTTSATHCAVSANPELMVATGTTTNSAGFGYSGVHQMNYAGSGDAFLFRLHYAVVPLGMVSQTPDTERSLDERILFEATDTDLILAARGDSGPAFTELTVWDTQGRLVLERSLGGDEQLNELTRELRSGVFIALLQDPHGVRRSLRLVIP